MAYLPLSTANLPDPAINPAQGSSPADYFNTVLTESTGSTLSVDVGFAADFLWTKARNFARSHELHDRVRGDNKRLKSDANTAEESYANYVVFDADGADLGTNHNLGYHADGTTTGVVWAWKAGTSFSNSAGTNGASIASSGSANTDSGFSIVSYTGDSTGTDGTASTVFHGLSQAPEMIMFKPLDTYDGAVYHSGLTSASYRLVLFSASGTAAQASDNGFFNGTAPTSSVFSIGSRKHTNSNGGMIAYCFHSVEGFSKFGSYTGNGNADGTFVYTGFRPAFLLLKVTSVADDWIIWDGVRSPENLADNALKPNSSAAEVTGNINNSIDLVSNGFKCRNNNEKTNFNGYNYIYMAFAENPFKYSNAR